MKDFFIKKLGGYTKDECKAISEEMLSRLDSHYKSEIKKSIAMLRDWRRWMSTTCAESYGVNWVANTQIQKVIDELPIAKSYYDINL